MVLLIASKHKSSFKAISVMQDMSEISVIDGFIIFSISLKKGYVGYLNCLSIPSFYKKKFTIDLFSEDG